ncbi:BrnT family toxin [Desulfonatronum thioautotrophicum]|uniref:BrnT family toxin n=1 Tax=Desulfonatronum thioautotrophicum TaxID=617001 RepID=UPI0005EBD595|nr:BrnT family toxin [Desulfonatronum thioautotrophicum]
MSNPKNRLRACTGFQWDDGNATKNWEKHDVSQCECEQVFFNQPLIVRRDKLHSTQETRYYVLGSTDADRLLFVCFTVRGELIRVISARNMTPNEIVRNES